MRREASAVSRIKGQSRIHMYYLKTLFLNFFIVFFANYVLPGIEVMNHTKLPHIGGDVILAFVLGLINSLIYPILRMIHQVSVSKILGLAIVINFVAYAIIKFVPTGIQLVSIQGYLLASIVVAAGSFFTNFLEMKHNRRTHSAPPPPSHEDKSSDL